MIGTWEHGSLIACALLLASSLLTFGCSEVAPAGSGGGGGTGAIGGSGGTGGAAGDGGSGGASGGVGGAQEICGSPSAELAICGSVLPRPDPVPDGSLVVALWVNDLDVYKFGEGTTSGDEYVLELAGPPPSEAIIGGTLGIAIIVVFPASVGRIPDGPIADFQALYDQRIGIVPRDAIIYRDMGSLVEWDMAFPDGVLSCAACVFTSETFDEFEPIDCEDGMDVESSFDVNDLDYVCNFD